MGYSSDDYDKDRSISDYLLEARGMSTANIKWRMKQLENLHDPSDDDEPGDDSMMTGEGNKEYSALRMVLDERKERD